MKRSGAIWLVAAVIAVAAALMYFVVLPQIRDGRTIGEIARKAEETVKDVKDAVNDAGKDVGKAADGTEEIKAAALVKMQRIGQDTKGAADEMKSLFDKGTPSAEQLAQARARLTAALKSASDLKLPAEADGAAQAAAAKVSEGARAALAALDALPTDPAQAKAALADLEARLTAALADGGALDPAEATAPVAGDDAATTSDAAASAEKPADAAIPAFDILRVEKDGSTVIAGRAQPGARIEIVDGDKVIASADADPTGDFAAVLDNPLSSGDHSITLKATTRDGKSSTSKEVATVSVPKDASGELLAMVTRPGEASRIITMPEVEVAKAKTEEATKTAAGATVATPDLPASSADIASTPPVVTQNDAAARTEAQQTANADQSAADMSAATTADAAQQTDPKQPGAAPEVMVSAVELEGDRIFIAGNTRPGATVRLYADDRIVAEATADGDGRFVADGTIKLAVGNHTIRADVLGGDGSKVELRASVPFFRPEGDLAAVASNDTPKDKPAIEPLANGTFDKAREEAGKALGLLKGLYAGDKMPTAEELAAARSSAEIALKSLAAVRVPADVDPALAAMAARASQKAGKALEKLEAVPADVAAFKAALGDVETMVSSAVKPATEVASASDASRTATEPTTIDGAAVADETVDKAEGQVSADEVQVTAKVDRLAKSAVATAQDQVPAPADGTSAATTGDQAADQQTASADQPKIIEQAPLRQSDGSVIIRKGDTLWQISRRVYGKGVRYTTIYVANKTQIIDPDRIMPGQIFSMPGKWLDNAEEMHKERLLHHKP